MYLCAAYYCHGDALGYSIYRWFWFCVYYYTIPLLLIVFDNETFILIEYSADILKRLALDSGQFLP